MIRTMYTACQSDVFDFLAVPNHNSAVSQENTMHIQGATLYVNR